MKRADKPNRHTVSGLRTRFFPKSRIGQGLISAAPWVDVVLLVVLFVLLESKFVLQPGCIIRLPEVPFTDGSRSVMTATVLSVEGTGSEEREEVVFFDDVRYLLRRDRQVTKLKDALLGHAKAHKDADLVIQADGKVKHATMMKLCDMAKEVGISRINIASRQASASGTNP